MLAVIRHHEELDEESSPAFILAACNAADGRDWIAAAPSLPPLGAPGSGTGDLLADLTVAQVAITVASLSDLLVTRLAAHTTVPIEPRALAPRRKPRRSTPYSASRSLRRYS